MPNPYKRSPTPYQASLIACGRQRLVNAWNDRSGKYARDQRVDFTITFSQEHINTQGTVDCFVGRKARTPLARAWGDQERANDFSIEYSGVSNAPNVDDDTTSFRVYVPHAYYFNASWFGCEIDAPLVLQMLLHAVIACSLAYLAGVIALA